jgi:ribosomal protein S18 acetylase RimI-like enzyme
VSPDPQLPVISRWTEDDVGIVRDILRETWHDAYGGFIAAHDLDAYLDDQYSPGMLGELMRSRRGSGYIARVVGEPAGLMRTEADAERRRLYLASLYVRPRFQGTGIGNRLLLFAEAEARERGAETLWLGVMVKNTRALEWYRRKGFAFVEEAPFVMGGSIADHLIGFRPVTP